MSVAFIFSIRKDSLLASYPQSKLFHYELRPTRIGHFNSSQKIAPVCDIASTQTEFFLKNLRVSWKQKIFVAIEV